MVVVLILCVFLMSNISHGANTISANQTLSGDQTIVSASGTFELGFFKPGKPSNYYIGMWFKNGPSKTILWVANRDRPVVDRFSSMLKISHRNLVLFSESKVPIWSTNVESSSVSSASFQAVLLDNGNLILNDGSNTSKFWWQSFDHPTHTFLLESKLGYNNITKTKTRLTSWKSSEDPSPGQFSFEIDLSDNSFIILSSWSRKYYWTSGPWNGEDFSFVPEMKLNLICYFEFVTNQNESYLTHFLYNFSTVSQFVMDVSGQIKAHVWLPAIGWKLIWSFPRQQCEVYAFCGAFGSCSEKSLPFCSCLEGFKPRALKDWDLMDYSGGCLRKEKLQCGNSSVGEDKRDGFRKIPSMSLPDKRQSVTTGNMAECEATCLDNCSCTAYAYDKNGCSIWIGDLLDLKQLEDSNSGGQTLYIRLAASEFRHYKNRKGLIIGAEVGSAAGSVVLLGIVLFLISRQRRKAVATRNVLAGSLAVFSYKALQSATKNFSEQIGRGGFGSVFKGVLPDSSVIAVKKLEGVGQGEKQFRAEVATIGTIQHVNLVRLRGFCSQGTKKLLVYDYMSNGSLVSHLFHKNKPNVLDWKTRYQIALGTARGLVYLHQKCRDCIIHCDIKPENILLDSEFCPKVADFGLAKLVGRNFSRVLTTMRGTIGYLAPEWIEGVAITSKADVYSFGMMLFEFVSGQRNTDRYEFNGKAEFFPSLAAHAVVEDGNMISLLDPRLEGNADAEEVIRVCKVACWCVQNDEARRPSMSQVVQILDGITELNLPPIPPFLQSFDDNEENVVFVATMSSEESSHVRSDVSTCSYESTRATPSLNSSMCSES